MNINKTFFPLILSIVICSCSLTSTSNDSISGSVTGSSSVADSIYFDFDKNYIGTSVKEFETIAKQYTCNPYFKFESLLDQNGRSEYFYDNYNSYVMFFSYKNKSILISHNQTKILDFRIFDNVKFTYSKAREFGLLENKYTRESEVHYKNDNGEEKSKISYTTRYELDLEINKGCYLERFESYSRFFKQFALPSSMFFYYDSNNLVSSIEQQNDSSVVEGLVLANASAIPLWSDDCSEIVGAITISRKHLTQSPTNFYLNTYLLSDNFDKIIKADDMRKMVEDDEIKSITNPCFYVPEF